MKKILNKKIAKHFKVLWHWKHEMHSYRYVLIGVLSVGVVSLLLVMANINTVIQTFSAQAAWEGSNKTPLNVWVEGDGPWEVKANGKTVDARYVAYYVQLADSAEEMNGMQFPDLDKGAISGVDLFRLSKSNGYYDGVARLVSDDRKEGVTLNGTTLFKVSGKKPEIKEAYVYAVTFENPKDLSSISSFNEVRLAVGEPVTESTQVEAEPSENKASSCPAVPAEIVPPSGHSWNVVCSVDFTCKNEQSCESKFGPGTYWCYGFEGGNRCMKLEAEGGSSAGEKPKAPAEGAGSGAGGDSATCPVGLNIQYWDADNGHCVCTNNKDRWEVHPGGISQAVCESGAVKPTSPPKPTQKPQSQPVQEQPAQQPPAQQPPAQQQSGSCPAGLTIAYWDDKENHCVCTNNVDTWKVLEGVTNPGVCAQSATGGSAGGSSGDTGSQALTVRCYTNEYCNDIGAGNCNGGSCSKGTKGSCSKKVAAKDESIPSRGCSKDRFGSKSGGGSQADEVEAVGSTESSGCQAGLDIAYWDDTENHCVCTNNVDTWLVHPGGVNQANCKP